ncbi:MAG: endonuclease/exonuclease/phosphatase family protein [Anaerolineae bacterium]|nr:endonuclease/exonuclease/phosphatase family protein [Anaerolineae bacterium]
MKTHKLKILTWNLYLGGDHTPLLRTTPETLPPRMMKLWETVQKTSYPSRVRAIAAVIARTAPDFVGLQEAMRWSVDGRPTLHTPYRTVVYDFVPLLLGELAARGCHYSLVARSPGVDVLLPTGQGFDVHFEDAVAILGRVQAPDRDITWANPRAERFSQNLVEPVGGQPLTLSRQWTSVDVTVGGQPVRFVNAHIEYADETVRDAQCAELLAKAIPPLGQTVILAGDFNAEAEKSKTWEIFAKSGFTDAFQKAGKGSGATWGQNEMLNNPKSQLTQRLDWILYRGKARAGSAMAVGDRPGERTGKLWPSDHAGVLAHIVIGEE